MDTFARARLIDATVDYIGEDPAHTVARTAVVTANRDAAFAAVMSGTGQSRYTASTSGNGQSVQFGQRITNDEMLDYCQSVLAIVNGRVDGVTYCDLSQIRF
jgi:hypothetical protein